MNHIFFTIFLFIFPFLSVLAQEHALEPKPPMSIEFAPEGGFYESGVQVELLTPNATIYFTTDGSDPQISREHKYRKPIQLDTTAVIRAIAVKGKEKSDLLSHTYFIEEPNSNFPTISISMNPEVLFDPDFGIFMKGTNVVDSIWKKPGANFWTRKEIPASIEIYETDGQPVYRNLSGLRLFGGMSRLFPQKSMAIVARKRYGKKRFKHRFFGKEGLKKFKFLVLRNSGSDFGKSQFRDAFMTSLVEELDVDKQDSRPSHVYINGAYWGIYNIREKINRYYIASNHEVDKDSIDLLEHRFNRKRGSRKHYARLLNFIEKNDLSHPANYAWVQSQMEVGNFMDYKIAQIYFDNQDAGGNIKYWRPKTSTGKWRWVLYDTDWGFGLHDKEAYKNNSFDFHTKPDGPHWPNPPWSTMILRKLLDNPEFKAQFISRFVDYLNTSFSETVVSEKLAYFHQMYLPEIDRHLKRWRIARRTWDHHLSVMQTFGQERPTYIREQMQSLFDLGAYRTVKINTNHGGHVSLNDRIRVEDDFSGQYFENIPLNIVAKPHLGYRFSHWEGFTERIESSELTLTLTQNHYELKAVFEKFDHPLANQILINEISSNNRETGDWVEIYNYSDQKAALKNWYFTDNKNEFRLPDIQLSPKEYMILAEDSVAFKKVFPLAYNVVGDLGFGINKRAEMLKLFSPEGAAVDSVRYLLEPTDTAFTYNLLLPWLNNGDPENWEKLNGYGTPNAANEYYVMSTLKARQELWMQMGMATGVILICFFLLLLRHRGHL